MTVSLVLLALRCFQVIVFALRQPEAVGLSARGLNDGIQVIEAFIDEHPEGLELPFATDGSRLLTKHQVSQHLMMVSKTKNLTITCPKLQNITFTNAPPFDVLGIPDCGGVVRPHIMLYLPPASGTPAINGSRCELQPMNLPNNVTTACFESLIARSDVTKLVLLVHGFLNSFDTEWLHTMQADIQQIDHGTAVMIVGWGRGLRDIFSYWRAAGNTRYISTALFLLLELLQEMRSKAGAPGWYVHCAGHSLGGQVCGLTGKQLIAKNAQYKMDRISGMDPAGPLFCEDVPYPFNYEFINPSGRLGPNDAHFVDVIHTDGDARYLDYIPQYGTMMALGTVDFYPGSGKYYGCYQPGCGDVIDVVSCSHSRAHFLYSASLIEAACLASRSCQGDPHHIPKNCINLTSFSGPDISMGYWANPKVIGKYTVEVIAKDPYCAPPKP